MSLTKIALPGVSGYDFTSIVDAMVSNYSLPLNQMQQKQSSLEVKKNAWRDINTRISALENTMDKLSQASTWTTTSASSSNQEILSAKSAAGTVKGTFNIKVEQIAAAQTVVSAAQNVESAASSISGLSAGTFEIQVGEKKTTITVAGGDSLNKIAESINNAKIGVNASVLKVDGGYSLAILSTETGEANAAKLTEISGDILHTLGILKTDHSLNVSQEAVDANIIINGIAVTSSTNTVTTAIPGMTLTLNKEAPGTTVNVKVSSDYSEAQKAVQSFVDQYNSVMSFIEDKLKYNKETKAKGDLFADPSLQGIQSRLRNMVSSVMDNPTKPFNILADVGISTSAADFGKSAKLEFSTAEFNEALQKNADSVANLFGAPAGGVEPREESVQGKGAQGLANIMKEYLHPLVMYDGTLDKTNKNYDKQLDDLKKQIEAFTDRVANYAEKTRLRFSLLETQMASLGSQSEWLQGQISAMSTSSKDK